MGELTRFGEAVAASTVALIWTPDTPPRRWARIFAALRLIRWHSGSGLIYAPELIAAAFDATGYHVRLQALLTVESIADWADSWTGTRIVDALNDLPEPRNWALSSTLVESLAAYGEIEPLRSRQGILDEISTILAAPHEPANQRLAQQAFSGQYDPQHIVGPYVRDPGTGDRWHRRIHRHPPTTPLRRPRCRGRSSNPQDRNPTRGSYEIDAPAG